MALPLRSTLPTTPEGRKRNALLAFDLKDPHAFLAQLASRNTAVSAPAASKPKQAQPQPQAQPATPPATPPSTPTPPAPQPPQSRPQSRPTPQLATSFEAQRKAARDAYDAELAGFSQRSQQGNQVTPLEQKRALQRYNNELGRLSALENKGIRKKRGEQLRTERLAREDYANERAAAALDESTKRLTSMFDSTPKPPAVNTPSSSDRAAMSAQMAANDAQRAAADRLPAPATPAAPEPPQYGWLDNAITRTVKLLQDRMARTPTAQLSAVAAPAPTAATPAPAPTQQISGGAMPEPAQRYGLDTGVNQVISNLSSGNVAPGNIGIDQLGEIMRGATPKQLADLYDGLQALPPEQQRATLRQMIEQNQGLNVNLGQPEKITSQQLADIQELNAPSLDPMGALNDLARGFTNVAQNPVLQTVAGPGGLLGVPLRGDAIARERAMATTPEELRMIQAREAQANMQGALLDLAGAGAALRPQVTPSLSAPTTRVIDNPMVAGASRPILRGPGVLDVNPASPHAGRMMDVTPGKVGKPVTIVPGREGQIVDMPAPQAMPGVTPRDLPTSGGGPRQGPVRQITPAGTADEGFTTPTRQVKNVPADIRNPAGQRRGESIGVIPTSPTGKEQGPGTAATEGQMRTRRSNARVRELRKQDQVTDILNTLADLGVLPARSATSTPEAKPTPAPEAALAEVAKPATPAPAPAAEAPIPLAEPTGTTVGRNTVQATTVEPRATPAPGQKAQSRKSITEALKAYGTKVVEETRAILKKDRKGTVTDSDVLEYLKGLVPGKAAE